MLTVGIACRPPGLDATIDAEPSSSIRPSHGSSSGELSHPIPGIWLSSGTVRRPRARSRHGSIHPSPATETRIGDRGILGAGGLDPWPRLTVPGFSEAPT